MSVLRLANRRSTSPWSAGCHRSQRRCPQRGHRHRQRVVGVVLVRSSRAQHPDPRRQRGRHVDDVLARRDELLGQQIAEPAGRLDRPRPLLERLRPRQQLRHLANAWLAPCTTPSSSSLAADRHRGVRRLVRVDTNDHCHEFLRGLVGWDRGGHSCFRIVRARSSFEPHRGEIPTRRSSFESQPAHRPAAGTSRATPPGPRDATDQPQRPPAFSSRHFAAMPMSICPRHRGTGAGRCLGRVDRDDRCEHTSDLRFSATRHV